MTVSPLLSDSAVVGRRYRKLLAGCSVRIVGHPYNAAERHSGRLPL